MSDEVKGLYNKFIVSRRDGSPKHEDCTYFVLDWEHDPFTVPAAAAYADACEAKLPELAKDLRTRIATARLLVPALKDPAP